jgi:hypothetical protein
MLKYNTNLNMPELYIAWAVSFEQLTLITKVSTQQTCKLHITLNADL